jgi:pyruvate/2-oxoacid:ferredoxin oxidoreductase beta subunit
MPKTEPKKDIGRIMAAHGIPYIASTTPAHPHDMLAKFAKARDIRGFRFIHVLAACTPGWRIDSAHAIAAMRAAVDARLFPVYEIHEERIRITVEPKNIPVKEYLEMQGRFRHMTDEQIAALEADIDRQWKWLRKSEA